MATQSEHAAALQALRDQVARNRTEVLARIAELEAAVAAAGGTSPEVDAAFEALRTEVQASDDDVVPTT